MCVCMYNVTVFVYMLLLYIDTYSGLLLLTYTPVSLKDYFLGEQ